MQEPTLIARRSEGLNQALSRQADRIAVLRQIHARWRAG
jgi:hypothetical protein